MRVRVVDVNYAVDKEWIFKFADSNGAEYYMKDNKFYVEENLSNPITNMSLERVHVGMWINIDSQMTKGLNVVTRIID